jgi:putative ABC transport system permease protein
MNESIQTISFLNLALAFLPVVVVIFILWRWRSGYGTSIYAVFRMLVQLLLIGYVLVYIFDANSSPIVILVLGVMLFSSSWIALRTLKLPGHRIYIKCLFAIFVGAGSILILITQGVVNLQPWYMPSYMIPLAGMIFASAMNSISLAGERIKAEVDRGVPYETARNTALQAALIPITNSLFAVGLVSLPGMMTGQILSGVSPFIAARYQIMVMCMMFGSAGLSSAIFLLLIKTDLSQYTPTH